jgi:hypothetical protein
MLNATATPPNPQFHYSEKNITEFFLTLRTCLTSLIKLFFGKKHNFSLKMKNETYINRVLGLVLGGILGGG